jgi:hypothetical protein
MATIQKLYAIVRNRESWSMDEPELNDSGQPLIDSIAKKLGCQLPIPDAQQPFPADR